MKTEVVMYARMYGGKRLHIVTGPHAQEYRAACGAIPGTRGNGYPTPGWYGAQREKSVYYPICKACEATT